MIIINRKKNRKQITHNSSMPGAIGDTQLLHDQFHPAVPRTPVELGRLRHDLFGSITAEGACPIAAQGVHLAVVEAFAYDRARRFGDGVLVSYLMACGDIQSYVFFVSDTWYHCIFQFTNSFPCGYEFIPSRNMETLRQSRPNLMRKKAYVSPK